MLIVFGVVSITTISCMGHKKFGKTPKGERLERIKTSPNYKDGQFQNLNDTPQFGENYSMGGLIYEKLFKSFPNLKPIDSIPSIKTDLLNLDPKKNVLVWFGHSSYFMQIDGVRFLIDPVFSGNASPIPNTMKAYDGSNEYGVIDMPKIDYLLISHDHYDHLDYETIVALKPKVENIICGLGVGAHFEHWGYDPKIITEKDWHDSIQIKNDFTIFITPARHFSGRGLSRNKSLWVSYVLQTPTMKIYLGGDSGYDSHYSEIGNKFGSFDLAILENGQYNEAWPFIHQTPEETLKAAQDLNAKRILPVHSSKFALANHPWDEPLTKLTELNKTYNFSLATPFIGEILDLDDPNQKFEQWWIGLK